MSDLSHYLREIYFEINWENANSLFCGRLDLTAASCVHLLEPQWNPASEDQALARVHRMGQKRPVTTIRYAVKNSIEEVSKSQNSCKTMLTFEVCHFGQRSKEAPPILLAKKVEGIAMICKANRASVWISL